MEWERAKSYILLFFVLLNIVLGGLLVIERRRYVVSPQRQQAIVSIMRDHNITLETQLPHRFTPMRLMYVSGFRYDVNELAQVFFADAIPTRIARPRGYVLSYGTGELIVSHGFISYDNLYGHGGEAQWMRGGFEPAQARQLTDEFVRANWPNFRRDDEFIQPDWARITYRQVYRGYIVHSNFIEIIVTDSGIVQVEMQFADVLEVDRGNQPIAAPDEALLTFVQRVRYIARVTPMVVTHMDLVYFQADGSTADDGLYRLEPFYRVFIYGNERDPFLINAFTNEIIN